MATVIDALVVNLGLDPKAFVKGNQQATTALAKTRESAVKEGRQIERSIDSAGEAIERLARNALKLFAIFTGGRAIGTFVTDIGRADAAMGRMADRLGVAPERIAVFDNAIKRMGGSAGEGAAAFQRMADTVNELRSTGNSSALPALAKLQAMSGQQIRLNGQTEESLGDLAEAARLASEKVGASQASYELRNAGYGEAAINQLLKGRAELEKALAQSRRSGVVSKADADAARALSAQYEDLSDKVADFGRKISTALTPVLTDLMKRLADWIDRNKELLAQDVVEEVTKFAKALREIPWDDVGKGIREFIKGANDGAQAIGGWTRVAEVFFGLWALEKIGTVLAGIALIRRALVLGDTSLLAAMARVGLPVAIGAAAMGHGFQTPEQAAKDPDQAILQKEGIDRRDRVRSAIGRGWNSFKRMFGGGEAAAAEGGAGIRSRAARAARGDQSGGVAANPGAYKDVLDHIARSEGTAHRAGGGYNTSLGYGRYLPGGQEQNLTTKTLDEILELGRYMRRQPGNPNSSAMGRYQIVGDTLRDQMRKLGLKGTDLFDEKTQDRIAANLARQRGSNSVGLRQEWASLVGARNATAVALMQKVDPNASTMPLDRPQAAADAQRAKDIATIKDTVSGARRPDVLADPKDERRKPMASLLYGDTPPAARVNAAAVVSQAQSAQVDRMAAISNDNRRSSTSSYEAHFHGDMNFPISGDSREVQSNLRARLKEPQFVQAVNYGQA